MHRQYRITYTYLFIFFIFIFLLCSVKFTNALTIFYSGEEQGQLGLHGCGNEQVGGLAHRYTLIENLFTKHPGAVLNLHTGNLIDATDENAEWVYQIGLSALEAMKIDALCLGPNELSLSSETLAVIHADYPKIDFICANSKSGVEIPYLIHTVDTVNIAVVNVISLSHAQELPNISLIPPQDILTELKADLVNNSDVVVVVFHGTQEKAHILANANSWIDILIVAENQQKDIEGIHAPSTFIGENAIVTNVSQGASLGVLEVERDNKLQRHIFTNSYYGVSEKITPDPELSQLIEVYEASIETEETFEQNTTDVPENAIYITYFHKQGCQKCVRAVKVLKRLKEKFPQIVVEQRSAKTEQILLEAMGMLYKVSETNRMLTPAIFIGDIALIGELNEKQLEATVQRYLKNRCCHPNTGSRSRVRDG